MTNVSAVTREYEERREGERRKALSKYGEAALVETGRPDFDVMDFMINELVGLVRYGEMIEARSRMMLDVMEELPRATRDALRESIVLARSVGATASGHAYDAIAIRQRLKAKGLHLGVTERTQ